MLDTNATDHFMLTSLVPKLYPVTYQFFIADFSVTHQGALSGFKFSPPGMRLVNHTCSYIQLRSVCFLLQPLKTCLSENFLEETKSSNFINPKNSAQTKIWPLKVPFDRDKRGQEKKIDHRGKKMEKINYIKLVKKKYFG